jgi:hypothetical protein
VPGTMAGGRRRLPPCSRPLERTGEVKRAIVIPFGKHYLNFRKRFLLTPNFSSQ